MHAATSATAASSTEAPACRARMNGETEIDQKPGPLTAATNESSDASHKSHVDTPKLATLRRMAVMAVTLAAPSARQCAPAIRARGASRTNCGFSTPSIPKIVPARSGRFGSQRSAVTTSAARKRANCPTVIVISTGKDTSASALGPVPNALRAART